MRGYMLFAADTPWIGLNPHPAYAPQPAQEAGGEVVWARLYNIGPDREALEQEALDDLAAARDAVEEGDMEDCPENPDSVFPVEVDAKGALTVFDPDGHGELARYTPADVYGAFGMPVPEILPDPRVAAWDLIRDQIETLSDLFQASGVLRLETGYSNEEPDCGLLEIHLFGPDRALIPEDQDPSEGDLSVPPLVSRGEFGRVNLIGEGQVGSLRDVAASVFESLAEFVLDDPDGIVDRIRFSLGADRSLGVEIQSSVRATWSPPIRPEGPAPLDLEM